MPSVQRQIRVVISKTEEDFIINELPLQYLIWVLVSSGHLRKRVFQRKIITHLYKMPPIHAIEKHFGLHKS